MYLYKTGIPESSGSPNDSDTSTGDETVQVTPQYTGH